jgi:hypothetical protein
VEPRPTLLGSTLEALDDCLSSLFSGQSSPIKVVEGFSHGVTEVKELR